MPPREKEQEAAQDERVEDVDPVEEVSIELGRVAEEQESSRPPEWLERVEQSERERATWDVPAEHGARQLSDEE